MVHINSCKWAVFYLEKFIHPISAFKGMWFGTLPITFNERVLPKWSPFSNLCSNKRDSYVPWSFLQDI